MLNNGRKIYCFKSDLRVEDAFCNIGKQYIYNYQIIFCNYCTRSAKIYGKIFTHQNVA